MYGVCFCLDLFKGCLLLGLLDLAISFFLIDHFLRSALETSSINYTLLCVVAVFGICTCLLMIYGSILENHQSMIPHLVWEIILIIIYVVSGLISFQQRLNSDQEMESRMIAAIVGGPSFLGIYYWIVMYCRYQEIRKIQLL